AAPRETVAKTRERFCWCRFEPLLWPLAGLFAWTALIAVTFRREIVWRGITYRLRRDGTVEVRHRSDDDDETISIETFPAAADHRTVSRDTRRVGGGSPPTLSTTEKRRQ
ncbi:MAG: hypothetical protein D6741_06610, partial [Planctomycetota bacterium]